MAKDKKWVDCPSCGSLKTMVLKTNITFESNIKDVGKLKVPGLSGYFCSSCKDGIYSQTSNNKIQETHMRLIAIEESKKVPVVSVVPIAEITSILGSTRQDVYRLMRTGQFPYVIVAGEIHPYTKTVEAAKKRKELNKKKSAKTKSNLLPNQRKRNIKLK